MILWIAILIFIVLSVLLFIMDVVQTRGEENIISEEHIPDNVNVILVLGAGIEYNGGLCNILEDRLRKAVSLKKKVKNAKFLLSGEECKFRGKEIQQMKQYIMKLDKAIKEDDIILDCESSSTQESIYRAKNMFKVSRMIIVTNYYHLPRALYIANKLGIEAFGIFSDSREYKNIERYRERELLAQVRAFIYIKILNSSSKNVKEDMMIKLYNNKSSNNKFKNR